MSLKPIKNKITMIYELFMTIIMITAKGNHLHYKPLATCALYEYYSQQNSGCCRYSKHTGYEYSLHEHAQSAWRDNAHAALAS